MTSTSLAAFEAQARLARVGLFGGVITLGENSYTAAVTLSGDSLENEAGGPMPVRTLSAEVSKADLTTPPQKGAPLGHEGTTYTVLEVHGHESHHPCWYLRAYRRLS